MTTATKEKAAHLDKGVHARLNNGHLVLVAEREIYEGENETSIVPPQEIVILPKGVNVLRGLLTKKADQDAIIEVGREILANLRDSSYSTEAMRSTWRTKLADALEGGDPE